MLKFFLTSIIILIIGLNQLYSQCSCCSAAFSGSALAAGTSNVGVLKENTFRIIGMYRFLYGTNFYKGSEELKKSLNEELQIHFTGINIGYGVTKRFTLEAETGAFPDKNIDKGYQLNRISGFSSIALTGKYTILADKENSQEITIGAGGRLPFTSNKLLSGDPGLILQFFYFLNLYDDINLVLFQRNEFYFENSDNIKQGDNSLSSLFLTKNISENLTAILETRFDHLYPSELKNEKIIDTGRDILSLVPQFSYNFGGFSVSAFAEIPVYKNYEGIQLSEKIGAGLAFVYMIGNY